MIFLGKISKGHSSVKSIGGLRFKENILDGIKVKGRTRFSLEKF